MGRGYLTAAVRRAMGYPAKGYVPMSVRRTMSANQNELPMNDYSALSSLEKRIGQQKKLEDYFELLMTSVDEGENGNNFRSPLPGPLPEFLTKRADGVGNQYGTFLAEFLNPEQVDFPQKGNYYANFAITYPEVGDNILNKIKSKDIWFTGRHLGRTDLKDLKNGTLDHDGEGGLYAEDRAKPIVDRIAIKQGYKPEELHNKFYRGEDTTNEGYGLYKHEAVYQKFIYENYELAANQLKTSMINGFLNGMKGSFPRADKNGNGAFNLNEYHQEMHKAVEKGIVNGNTSEYKKAVKAKQEYETAKKEYNQQTTNEDNVDKIIKERNVLIKKTNYELAESIAKIDTVRAKLASDFDSRQPKDKLISNPKPYSIAQQIPWFSN